MMPECKKFKMILNLNDPSKIEDTSWIKPMKYVGIWWEMHVGNRLGICRFTNAQNSLTQNYCRQENMERLLKTQKIH
jgi:hypothetical protein